MLAEPAVPPYVLAGEGSCNEACLTLEAEPLVSWSVGSIAAEGSLTALALALSGVAGEPAMSSVLMSDKERRLHARDAIS